MKFKPWRAVLHHWTAPRLSVAGAGRDILTESTIPLYLSPQIGTLAGGMDTACYCFCPGAARIGEQATPRDRC